MPRNSVGTKQLRKNAVKGSKVANGSLSATDIGGAVNRAKEADHAATADLATRALTAASADQLSGAAAAGYLSSSRVQRIDFQMTKASEGVHEAPLLAMGPLSLRAEFNNGPTSSSLTIIASTSARSGEPLFGWSYVGAGGSDGGLDPVNGTPTKMLSFTSSGATGFSVGGNLTYRDAQTAIAIDFQLFLVRALDNCVLYGVATQA